MDWIKKHYDQFALALAALLLLALSGFLILKSRAFSDSFAEAQADVTPSEKVPALDLTSLQSAQALLDQPARWMPKETVNPFLFVPNLYVIRNNRPEPPDKGSDHKDSLTGKEIPNVFFSKNKLAVFDKTVPTQDPDKDGFTNEDEWRSNTDPNDPKAFPPYHTKLFLKQWIRVPFRLLFQAYDGDPAKPKEMSFQINAVDRGRRTEFLKLGEKVANSPFRLEKFEMKTITNPNTGAEEDVSVLTMTNTESGDPVALTLGKQTDSPDSFALFEYQWKGSDIRVKKLSEFVLLPETTKRYKLVDIKEGEALIQLPDGGKHTVTPDPRKR
jgi:hypothetical protein